MTTQLSYAFKRVGDTSAAVGFDQDDFGLRLRIQSPEWSEFETGSTTLALYASSPERPAGSCGLGFSVADIDALYEHNSRHGVQFTAVARKLGRVGGRKRRLTDSKIKAARRLLAGGTPPRDVADNLGVSVPTLYR